MLKKVKGVYSCSPEPISEPRSITCHMGSHMVTCHPTQVNVPHLKPKLCRPVLKFTYPAGMVGSPGCLVTHRDQFTCPQTITHASSYRAWDRATMLIGDNALTTTLCHYTILISDQSQRSNYQRKINCKKFRIFAPSRSKNLHSEQYCFATKLILFSGSHT